MDITLHLLLNIIKVFKWAIFARILLSWLQPQGGYQFRKILYEITEPYLRIFRNIIPRMGMIDLSPIIAFFALDFIQLFVISLFS